MSLNLCNAFVPEYLTRRQCVRVCICVRVCFECVRACMCLRSRLIKVQLSNRLLNQYLHLDLEREYYLKFVELHNYML